MNYSAIQKTDPLVYKAIKDEEERQKTGIELIPSENYAGVAVLEALGSIMTDKYSEGFPKRRYYGGNMYIDDVEILAQKRAQDLFHVPYANVQPYSGSPANFSVYAALCQPGDSIMGHSLLDGGHLTHGWKVSVTGKFFHSLQYGNTPEGDIDYDQIEKLVKKHKPKLIWCGATAYEKLFDYERFRQIADSVGAYFAADIAHVAGLIIAGVHPSPVPYAHIVTSTTHKTLRGPRGGIVMVTQSGIDKDPDLAKKIESAIFPGLQGGPHNNVTAAIAVALEEASRDDFKEYGKQIVTNAHVLAYKLLSYGYSLVGGGTQNHLMRMNFLPDNMNGWYVEKALEAANITVNKNTIPADPNSPYFPSGIRLGTPAVTTRGMKENEMETIASFMHQVITCIKGYGYIQSKLTKEHKDLRIRFKEEIAKDKVLQGIRLDVKEFSSRFPIPGID